MRLGSRLGALLFSLLATSAPAPAQDDDIYAHVALRVSSTNPGTAVIDRGSSDRVAIGDLVLFFPRDGGTYRGNVVQLDDRSAVVQLLDREFRPVSGTRGEVLVPKARLKPPTKRTPPPADGPADPPPDRPQPDRDNQQPGDKWRNRDDEWREGMPLLAQVKPVRPENRAPLLTGRVYTIGDLTYAPRDDFNSSLLRIGTEFSLDNPFGRGGGLQFDGETNFKTEVNDETGADLLVRRLSYVRGGTRYDSTRWEAGRFLQHGMPEFGVLDGFEWSQRGKNGDRFGASIGFMPELDDDFNSLADLQIAAYYYWAADERERLTIGGGFQKTLHNGKGDRDLLIGKLRYLPGDGWRVHATTWFDFYYGRDDIKNGGVEMTQALASVGHRWDNGDSVDLSFRRLRFPELLRNGEFLPVLADEIADKRYDRLALDTWLRVGDETRMHAHLSGFDDEDDSGGAGELGFDMQNLFAERSRTDVTAFGTAAQYSSVIGGRVTYGRFLDSGRFDLFYEVRHEHKHGFPNDADDLLQHRLRASRSFTMESDWDVTLHSEARLWDDEFSWSVGFFMQRELLMVERTDRLGRRSSAASTRIRPRWPAVLLLALLPCMVLACAIQRGPGDGSLHRWWAGLGPVLPHDTFPADCSLCHVGDKWNTLKPDFSFDHEQETGVALDGAHQQARCLRCHNDRGPVAVFRAKGLRRLPRGRPLRRPRPKLHDLPWRAELAAIWNGRAPQPDGAFR